jgi:hypothetical protein
MKRYVPKTSREFPNEVQQLAFMHLLSTPRNTKRMRVACTEGEKLEKLLLDTCRWLTRKGG